MLQFYRVEVKVLPPEADAAPRTRSVLRRFNHFTKLHQRVSSPSPLARTLPCALRLCFSIGDRDVTATSRAAAHSESLVLCIAAVKGGAGKQKDGKA